MSLFKFGFRHFNSVKWVSNLASLAFVLGSIGVMPIHQSQANSVIFKSWVPLADGSTYAFRIFSPRSGIGQLGTDQASTDKAGNDQTTTGESNFGEVIYRPKGSENFQVLKKGVLAGIPILEKNRLPTDTPFPMGPAYSRLPRETWVQINDTWHLLRYGYAIPFAAAYVPSHVLLHLPLANDIDGDHAVAFENIQNINYTEPFLFAGVPYLVFNVHVNDPSKDQTLLLRLSDGKTVMIDRQTRSAARLTPTIADGILTLHDCPRQISLAHFDTEAQFTPLPTETLYDVDSHDKRVINPLNEVKNTFKDYRVLAKTSPPADTTENRPLISQMKTIFLANKQNKSVVILGPSGSGKTTLALDFLKNLPPTWLSFGVEGDTLSANTKYVGAFEARIKTMLVASRQTPILWIFDEMHSLQGAGTHSGKSSDVFEILKRPIAAGEIMIIGTDTAEEYYQAFSGNIALTNRFQVINKSVPDRENVLESLRSWIQFSQLPVPSAKVLERIIYLASVYASTQAEPRRSVALAERVYSQLDSRSPQPSDTSSDFRPDARLDGRLSIDDSSGTTYSSHLLRVPTLVDVDRAAGDLYKLDPSLTNQSATVAKLKDLITKLDSRIVGLDHAKNILLSLSKKALAGLRPGKGPQLSALFFGRPGTGKTELGFAYADALDVPAVRIEMNRFTGWSAGEDLMNDIAAAVRKNPFSVIILDEIEKAPSSVMNSLLAMFDSGIFNVRENSSAGSRNSQMVRVSVQHTSFIMTSNAGTEWIHQKLRAGQSLAYGVAMTEIEGLKKTLVHEGLPAPFLDRIQAIVPITVENRDQFKKIIRLHVRNRIKKISEEKQIPIELVNENFFLEYFTTAYFHSEVSNREVLRAALHHLDDALADALLDPLATLPGRTISISCARTPNARPDFRCEQVQNP